MGLDYPSTVRKARGMKYTDGSLRNIHGDLWQARFSYRVEKPNGQVAWKQVSRNIHAQTQKEAQQEKERIRTELERAALLEEILPPEIVNSPKLSDFMNEKVDEQLRSGLIASTTYTKYKSEVKLILRFIDDVPVNDITADMVRTMGQRMLSSGYARETVARAHNALKRFLYLALEEGHVSSMPITRSVKPPRLVRKEPNALDDATRKRLLSILDEMPDDQLTLAIRLGLGAGLRNEEALGLQWENVNLHDGVIKVRNCICMAGGKVVEKGPKTSAGRRDVPIDPGLVKRLRTRARTVFGTQKLSKLQGFYVLGDTEGHYYGHHALSRAFHDFADKWEIYGTTGELATFYSLRHTYATMLLRAGVDAKTVASLMGHSSVAMTLNVYASTDPQAKAAAGAVVADLMTQR